MSYIGRFVNAILLIRVAHATRGLIVAVLILFSFLLLALALREPDNYNSFYYAIFACLFHGFSQAFGEATAMGYLKGFPSDLVMTFGSGTGMSGFTGVFTVIFMLHRVDDVLSAKKIKTK